MNECITDALVIDREESGEQDARVFLYTEALGGVVAKATSIRKITSKLATHLEPLNFVKVRLIERGNNGSTGYQIGDALTLHCADAWRASKESLRAGLELASIFKEGGFRGDPEAEVWRTLVGMFQHAPTPPYTAYGARLLAALGFDPRYAACGTCGKEHPARFSFSALAFFCDRCFSSDASAALADRPVIRLA